MNRKERERLVVLSRVKDKELLRTTAAEVLSLSLRQVHRLYLRYLAEGDKGLVHRSRGKPSVRKIDPSRRDKALVWTIALTGCRVGEALGLRQ